jgi:RNA 2',3'-cyclic 3'-phosphodiesterase
MSELPQTIRAFIAIKLPPAVRSSVEQVQRDLKSATRPGLVRWTPVEQIHLTLKFLGNIPTNSVPELDAALRGACIQVAPFELYASGLGCFPDSKRPRVLWVGLGGALDKLRELQKAIVLETERWGEPEDRPFHPHLTLGRTKSTRPRELEALGAEVKTATAADLGSWRVARVDLMKSELFQEGARHMGLLEVPLTDCLSAGETDF